MREHSIVWLLATYWEFRNLLYYRIPIARIFKFCALPLSTLYIYTKNIGKGLFIQHGFSTIVAAKSIGDYCWINQQVTIGYTNSTDAPEIGNNVHISACSIVIGNISIGNNAIIGVGAPVVNDVPSNATVVGPSAKVIKIKNI